MKIKNHYIWICIIWIIATVSGSLACVVKFVDGKIGLGFIFLILSVAFSFVSGILLNKAIAVYWHNKEVDWLHEYIDAFREKNEEPFKEFDND